MNLVDVAKQTFDTQNTLMNNFNNSGEHLPDFDSRVDSTNTVFDGKHSLDTDKRIELRENEKKDAEVKNDNRDDRVQVDKNIEDDNIESAVEDYIQELNDYSDCPETIPKDSISTSDLKAYLHDEVRNKRNEFSDPSFKSGIIKEWESINGREWPTYDSDVKIITKNGDEVTIRPAGSRYDAHHIIPLEFGGENIASNITPMRADVHIDHYGIHSLSGAFGRMESLMGVR